MTKKKIDKELENIGENKNGEELYKPTKAEYDTIQNIIEIHAEYLMESIAKSMAVLETRIEISNAMGEDKEVVYYTGALEQTKVYIDILFRSVTEVKDWCGVRMIRTDSKDNVVDAKKSKRIKRIPVTKLEEEQKKMTLKEKAIAIKQAQKAKEIKGTLRKPRPKIDLKTKVIEALKKKKGGKKK